LTGFILNGWQWMSRGINKTPATVDRAISRNGNLQKADLRTYLPWFIQVAGEYRNDLLAMQKMQEDGVTKLSGFRYFPYADFCGYQQRNVSFFLKTISQRTEPAESINNENLQGQLLNFGNTYFIRNGNEYYDLMPVWDWKKLPGQTVFKDFSRPLKSHFTGSVSSGIAGFSVMDAEAADSLQGKSVSKFWAFYKGQMICLIAGLNKGDSTATILDQCRLQGKVTVNRQGRFLNKGSNQLSNVQWAHHAGLAYIPLGENKMEIQLKAATGSWSLINAAGSQDIIKEHVFIPVLCHYVDSASAYMVADAATPIAAENISKHIDFRIVKNTKKVQALLFNKGDWMVVFRNSNMDLQIGKSKISADKPCLLMHDGKKIYVSDPLHSGGLLTVKINQKAHKIVVPSNGTTVSFKP
jgi:chondroitin AC lyase